METLTIKIKDSKALRLIRDPEDLDLIQVIIPKKKKSTAKLSSILSGSFSVEEGHAMQKELQNMRNEWERNIF